MRKHLFLIWAVVVGVLGGILEVSAQIPDGAFMEQNGLLVMEVESVPPTGSWRLENYYPGFTGTGCYTWRGLDYFAEPGHGTLTYPIYIAREGYYRLSLHNRHEHPDPTLENDAWTRMDDGPWKKTYSHTRGEWTWDTTHEYNGQHSDPVYPLLAGVHWFYISGRSANFMIDRIHLYDILYPNPLNTAYPESPRHVEGTLTPSPTGTLPTTTATATLTRTPTPTGQFIVSYSLMNADTNQPIPAYDPLLNAAVINLSQLPTGNLNVRANPHPATVGSVVFNYDNESSYRIDNTPPYTLMADGESWRPPQGPHRIAAAPRSQPDGQGTSGPELAILIAVTGMLPAGTPSATPSPTALPTPRSADLNADGLIDDRDLFLFMQEWQTEETSFRISW